MSDRRPENPKLHIKFGEDYEVAVLASDALAAVRRAVESGEIEGLPLFCAAHWCALTPDETTCSLYQRVEGMDACSVEYRILLIPTTDSERYP